MIRPVSRLACLLLCASFGSGFAQSGASAGNPRFVPNEVDVIVDLTHGYSSIEGLAEDAELILLGTYLEAGPGRWFGGHDRGGSAVSDHKIAVRRVLKGALDTPSILITQLGGEIGGTKYIVREYLELKAGQELLCFLMPSDEKMERTDKLKRYSVVGFWAGCFALEGQKVKISPATSAPLRELAAQGTKAVLDALASSLVAEKP